MTKKPHLYARSNKVAREIVAEEFKSRFGRIGQDAARQYMRAGRSGLLRAIDESEKLYRSLANNLAERLIIDVDVLRGEGLPDLDKKTLRAFRDDCSRRSMNLRLTAGFLRGRMGFDLQKTTNEAYVLIEEIDRVVATRILARFGYVT